MPEMREPRILGQPVLSARDFIQRMHGSVPPFGLKRAEDLVREILIGGEPGVPLGLPRRRFLQ